MTEREPDPAPAGPGPAAPGAPPRWWVAGPDQKMLGPYEAEAVRQWVSEGRISGGTFVCRDGEEGWVRAATVEAFDLRSLRPGASAGVLGGLVPAGTPLLPLVGSWLAAIGIIGFVIGPVAFGLGLLSHRHYGGSRRVWFTIIAGAIESLALAAVLYVLITR